MDVPWRPPGPGERYTESGRIPFAILGLGIGIPLFVYGVIEVHMVAFVLGMFVILLGFFIGTKRTPEQADEEEVNSESASR